MDNVNSLKTSGYLLLEGKDEVRARFISLREFVNFVLEASIDSVSEDKGYPSTSRFYERMIERISRDFSFCKKAAIESYAPFLHYFKREGCNAYSPVELILPTSSGQLIYVKPVDFICKNDLGALVDGTLDLKGEETDKALGMAVSTQILDSSRAAVKITQYPKIEPFNVWLARVSNNIQGCYDGRHC